MQTIEFSETPVQPSYQFGWFDWFCLWYPPAWLILLNRHWQHYKPDPDGWRWTEYPLFLLPGGFYLALLIRWLRLTLRHGFRALRWHQPESLNDRPDHDFPDHDFPDAVYQQAFRDEILTAIVQHYFRAELYSNQIPSSESVIVALNHAGMCFPWDFLSLALLLSQQQGRLVQPLAHPLFFDHLWLKWWLPQGWAQVLGGVRAEAESFEAAIAQNTILLYAPEGWRGLAKGWRQRYQLATFDASFVRLSLRYRVPILPVVCIGSEWLHPFALNVGWMARLVKMPMFPISPLIPVFALFPSMGVWASRSQLQYYLQPLWRPWEELADEDMPRQSVLYRLAQELRSRLQGAIEEGKREKG